MNGEHLPPISASIGDNRRLYLQENAQNDRIPQEAVAYCSHMQPYYMFLEMLCQGKTLCIPYKCLKEQHFLEKCCCNLIRNNGEICFFRDSLQLRLRRTFGPKTTELSKGWIGLLKAEVKIWNP